MEPRHHLDNLRTAQSRNLATIRRAIPLQVEGHLSLGDPRPGVEDPTELQLRLVIEDLLGPHAELLAELELRQAKQFVGYFARARLDDGPARWISTAGSSISNRMAGADGEFHATEGDRDAVKLLRDAVALIEAADQLQARAA